MRHSLLPDHQVHSDVLQTVCARTMEMDIVLPSFPSKDRKKQTFEI